MFLLGIYPSLISSAHDRSLFAIQLAAYRNKLANLNKAVALTGAVPISKQSAAQVQPLADDVARRFITQVYVKELEDGEKISQTKQRNDQLSSFCFRTGSTTDHG
jgi:hypothetical protein